MSNFGFRRLRVVNPFDVAFHEARSAVGAADLLANAGEYKNVADAVADCALVVGTTAGRNRRLQQALRPLNEAAGVIRKRLQSAQVALLFGSEKVGLSSADMSHCHWLVRIPTQESHVSMNLGQAVAVCLYELARPGARQAPGPGAKLSTAADFERITQSLFNALRISDYVKSGDSSSSQERVRRLIRRLNLQSADAELLLGMLRQITWKLNRR